MKRSLLVRLIAAICSLSFSGWAAAASASEQTFHLGQFELSWNGKTQSIKIMSEADSSRILWQSATDQPIVTAAYGQERVRSSRGSFKFQDRLLEKCREPLPMHIIESSDLLLRFKGAFADCELDFSLSFTALSSEQLGFELSLDSRTQGEDHPFNRIWFNYASSPKEGFYGFGQQYTFLDLKGQKLPIWAEEQGHGRGLQPLTGLLNLVTSGSGGAWHTTYTAVPFYLSSLGHGFMLENSEFLEFDMTEEDLVSIHLFSNHLRGRLIDAGSPLANVTSYTKYSGRMKPLPTWTQEGVILRAYGGSEEVRSLVRLMEEAGVPLSGLWIEDWMGRRENFTGSRLWWNWELDRSLYPDWEDLIQEMRQKGVRIATYFNPYLTDASRNSQHSRNFYQEAKNQDFFVKRPDGSTYKVGAGGFDGALLDLTNPAASTWLKGLMREQLDLGVSGWMADFGEALPYEAKLYSGVDSRIYHNNYPEDWARVNREVIREAGLEGDAVFWTRSGNSRSPGQTTLAWLGDQTVTWDAFDGIKTVVTGLVSSGLSGYSLSHADIGGYLSVHYPFILKMTRSQELLFRWVELSAFQAVMRTHDSILPDSNHQVYSDAKSLAHFAKFAQVFQALAPYRQRLMEEARDFGYPLVRHPMLHFPSDPVVYRLNYQFMFGDSFMVAPVLDPEKTTQRVYLPRGQWVHLWTQDSLASQGEWFTVDAPVGKPPVFYPYGSVDGQKLRHELTLQGQI